MRVGVIGINHKLAELKLREAFAKICQHRFCSSFSKSNPYYLVVLSTCNRTEMYFSSPILAETHTHIINILREDLHDVEETFDQKLYSYFGHDCFRHLARVTTGLDSAIAAETEVQGQVKAAYERALDVNRLPSEMHFLFQKSLKIAKKVRTELPLGRGLPNVEHAILNASLQTFDKPEKAKVLFVGASDINRKIFAFLRGKLFEDMTLCNRSNDTAKVMADKYGLRVLEWDAISRWQHYDMIVFGTKSPDFLVSKKDLCSRPMHHKLIIDLSVPRNVDPSLGRLPHITLLNIDQLNKTLKNRKTRMQHLLSQAEEIVQRETRRQIYLYHDKEQRRIHYLAAS